MFLNLVRNVNDILEHLSREMTESHPELNSDDSGDEIRVVRSAKTLPPLRFKEKHRLLKLKLGPLQGVQSDLERILGAASMELYNTSVTTAAPFDHPNGRRALQEFSINSSNGWKSALDKFRTLRNPRPEVGVPTRRHKDEEDEIAEIIASCREDMRSLWEDSVIREMLNRRKARIEDAPGL